MADIRFDTGVKQYNLNGAVTVSFCPTDMTFIERFYNALESLDKRQEKYRSMIDGISNAEVFDVAKRFDAECRADINAIFGTDICTPLFGTTSITAIADGLPLWTNLMLALLDELDGTFAEEQKRTNPRLQKYTEKYKRK